MPTGLAYSPEFLKHRTGPGHPESHHRLQAIHENLAKVGLLDQMTAIDFSAAEIAQI